MVWEREIQVIVYGFLITILRLMTLTHTHAHKEFYFRYANWWKKRREFTIQQKHMQKLLVNCLWFWSQADRTWWRQYNAKLLGLSYCDVRAQTKNVRPSFCIRSEGHFSSLAFAFLSQNNIELGCTDFGFAESRIRLAIYCYWRQNIKWDEQLKMMLSVFRFVFLLHQFTPNGLSDSMWFLNDIRCRYVTVTCDVRACPTKFDSIDFGLFFVKITGSNVKIEKMDSGNRH